LFRRLEDDQQPRKVQLRFLLALLLWRKKTLRLGHTEKTADGEVWEFVATATEDVHRVLRPALDEEHLEQLSAQLEQLLSGAEVEFDGATTPLEDTTDG